MSREPIWLMDAEEVEDYVLVEAIVDAAEARRFAEREYDGLDPFMHFMPATSRQTLYPALPDGWDDHPIPQEKWRPLTLDEALAIPYEESLTWRRSPAADGHAGIEFWHIEVHELERDDVERLIEAKVELDALKTLERS